MDDQGYLDDELFFEDMHFDEQETFLPKKLHIGDKLEIGKIPVKKCSSFWMKHGDSIALVERAKGNFPIPFARKVINAEELNKGFIPYMYYPEFLVYALAALVFKESYFHGRGNVSFHVYTLLGYLSQRRKLRKQEPMKPLFKYISQNASEVTIHVCLHVSSYGDGWKNACAKSKLPCYVFN